MYIHYTEMLIFITVLWCVIRAAIVNKKKQIDWKRELELLLVYICIIVVARFTFFPFAKVDGKIQPLFFDAAKMYPFRINLEPLVHLNDYVVKREAVLNFVGNIAMFIPIGIIFPCVYEELNAHWKAIAAGIGFSLAIEILQLPFFDRVSDVDDLILNSLGYVIGYGIYLLMRVVTNKRQK